MMIKIATLPLLLFIALSISSSLIPRPLSRTLFDSLVANGSITSLDDIAKFNLTDLNSLEHIDYSVPNTSILLRLVLHLGTPVERAAVGRVILTAQRAIRRYIADNGDAYLDDDDDPYEVDDRRSGKCMIGMKSTKQYTTGDERLKYSRVLITFDGLFNVLYLARNCYSGIFQIEDRAEIVGTGKVLVGNVDTAVSTW